MKNRYFWVSGHKNRPPKLSFCLQNLDTEQRTRFPKIAILIGFSGSLNE